MEIIFLEHSTAGDLWKPELQCPCQLLPNLRFFCLFVSFLPDDFSYCEIHPLYSQE